MSKQKGLLTFFISILVILSSYGQNEVELNGKGNQTHTYKSSTGVTSTELEYRGKILFNDDETDVAYISPGGFLKFSKKSFGTRRTIELEGESNGNILRSYKEGSKKIAFEPEGRKWMASVLPEIIRTTGIGAEERVKKFYSKGGLDAVLNEIDQLKSDYVQSIYYTATLQLDGLSNADVQRILQHAGDELSSSYEQSKLLRNNSDKFSDSEANMNAALKYVEGISSSYEQSKIYIHFLTKEDLSEANKSMIIKGVREISSTYEQSKVLVAILKDDLSDTNIELVIAEIPNISSSYEQSKVLSYLVKNQEIDEIDFDVLLKAISSISSSYEQSKVLRYLVTEHELNTEQVITIAKASSYISSDYEQSKFIQNLINKQDLNEESIEVVLSATDNISSSYERTKVLTMIANSDNFSQQNFDSFLKYASEISSSYDQSKVLRILTEMDNLSDEDQLALIKTIGAISSKYERSKLLLSLAPNLSTNGTVREAFLDEAKTLSDTDFGKVMRSMN
jgi:hypothetical protein